MLHSTPVPLVLVRQGVPCPTTDRIVPAVYRRILVPLDQSPFVERALPLAQQLVSAIDGTLYLAGVAPTVDSPVVAESGLVPWWMLEAEEERGHRLVAYLQTTAARLSESNVVVTPEVLHGTPAAGLLQVIDERQIDLVVMATHERNLLHRLVDASVASQVLQDVKVPLLLIREPARRPDQMHKARRIRDYGAVDSELEPTRRKGAVADLSKS